VDAYFFDGPKPQWIRLHLVHNEVLSMRYETSSRLERPATADALCRSWSWADVGQTGSHIILQTEQRGHRRIPIPAHKTLRIGTLNAILRLVATHKGVPRQQILDTIA